MNLSRRMLPLLDVSILLLGLFIVLMAQANFEKEEIKQQVEDAPPVFNPTPKHVQAVLNRMPLVLLYGHNNVKARRPDVYEVRSDMSLGRLIDQKETFLEALRSQQIDENSPALVVVATEGADQYFGPSWRDTFEAWCSARSLRKFTYVNMGAPMDFLDKSRLE